MTTITDLILIRDTIRVAIRMEEIESMRGAQRIKERPLAEQTCAFLQQAQIADLLASLREPLPASSDIEHPTNKN